MLAELTRLGRTRALPPIDLIDVDSDPLLQRRHGLDVPVLLLDGSVVCRHRLDRAELERLLGPVAAVGALPRGYAVKPPKLPYNPPAA